MRTRLLIVVGCLASLVSATWLAGAGQAQASTGGDAVAVQAVLLRFADARFADDGTAMCPLFTVHALRSFGMTGPPSGCPSYLTTFFGASPAAAPTLAAMEARYSGGQIEVDGSHALVTVSLAGTVYLIAGGRPVAYGGTMTYNEALVRRHGDWLITSMSATGA